MNENDFFETSDISLVAALLCFNAVIEEVDRSSARAVFCLRKGNINELVKEFHNHSLHVEPLTYFNALKEAKSRLYSPHD